MTGEGKLYKRLRKCHDSQITPYWCLHRCFEGSEWSLGGVLRILDEAKKDYLAIPKKVEEAMKTNFIGSYADIKPFFELEWFKKWFGAP